MKNKSNHEENNIGELKRRFVRQTHRRQVRTRFSPLEVSGNISLGYYRGIAQGREDAINDCIQLLKQHKLYDAVKILSHQKTD